MGKHVNLGVTPWNEFTIEPNNAVAVGKRHNNSKKFCVRKKFCVFEGLSDAAPAALHSIFHGAISLAIDQPTPHSGDLLAFDKEVIVAFQYRLLTL
jgi:hypothetical protein